jgi:hypothetical protein
MLPWDKSSPTNIQNEIQEFKVVRSSLFHRMTNNQHTINQRDHKKLQKYFNC